MRVSDNTNFNTIRESIQRSKERPGNGHSVQRVQSRQGLRFAHGWESPSEVRPARHHVDARRFWWRNVLLPLGVGMDE